MFRLQQDRIAPPSHLWPRSPRTAAVVALVGGVLLVAGCSGSGSTNAPRNTALTRANHPRFPISGGSHGSVDCNVCHGDFDTFAQFTCLSSTCHPDPDTSSRHSGISGYAYQSDRCYACHQNGSAEVNHAAFFPITQTDTHGSVGCSDCHTNASDYKQVTCDACHAHPASAAPTAHAAVAGFGTVASQCLRCHAESQVTRVADHLPFQIDASSAHAQSPCFSCHPAMRTDKTFAADFSATGVACLSCHGQTETNASHSGMAGYAYDSSHCVGCHASGTRALDHSAFFPIATGDTHTGLNCSDCHTNATDYSTVTCDGCHSHPASAMPAAHTAVAGFASVGSQCLRCHGDSQVTRVAQHLPFKIGTGTAHDQSPCFGCHPAMRADKSFAADFGASAVDCLSCHHQTETAAGHPNVSGYAYETGRCVSCHPDGTANVDHTAFFPIATADTHGGLACADCHTTPTDYSKTTCDACHSHLASAMPAAHSAVYGFASVASQCLRCHAESQVTRVSAHLPFRIGSGTSHSQSKCFDCHPQMRADKTFAADFTAATVDCLSCHSKSSTDGHHQEVSGYSYQSQSCIKSGCHADGSRGEGN